MLFCICHYISLAIGLIIKRKIKPKALQMLDNNYFEQFGGIGLNDRVKSLVITIEFNVYNSYLFMKNFLTYKSKIVKCKRDSQKLQQFNLLQLLREFQSSKLDKKQFCIIERSIQQLQIEKTLVDQLRQDCLFQSIDSQQEKISQENDKYMQKQESTMQSLCEEQEGQSLHHKHKSNKFLQNNQYHKSKSQNQHQSKKTIDKTRIDGIPHKIRKMQSQLEIGSQANKEYQSIKFKHQQGCILFETSNQLGSTPHCPLQLVKHKSNKNQESKMNWKVDTIIKQQDEQKIEMLFRQQYKGLFSSSISDIQFKQGTITTSSFQNELQSSQGLLGNTKKESRFTSILNVLNKKDKYPSQSLPKKSDALVVPAKRKRRIMILEKKAQNHSVDKVKSCQKDVQNKNTKVENKKNNRKK